MTPVVLALIGVFAVIPHAMGHRSAQMTWEAATSAALITGRLRSCYQPPDPVRADSRSVLARAFG